MSDAQPVVSEERSIITKETSGPTQADSCVGGVSVRAWLVVMLVVTVCLTHVAVTLSVAIDAVLQKDFSKLGTFSTIGEPLYSMAVVALGYYFGQKTPKT